VERRRPRPARSHHPVETVAQQRQLFVIAGGERPVEAVTPVTRLPAFSSPFIIVAELAPTLADEMRE
jgi:hypothetical protein